EVGTTPHGLVGAVLVGGQIPAVSTEFERQEGAKQRLDCGILDVALGLKADDGRDSTRNLKLGDFFEVAQEFAPFAHRQRGEKSGALQARVFAEGLRNGELLAGVEHRTEDLEAVFSSGGDKGVFDGGIKVGTN